MRFFLKIFRPYLDIRGMNGYAVGRQNGWMSANDIRKLENMDKISEEQGGDLYLVNGNMIRMTDATRNLELTENRG